MEFNREEELASILRQCMEEEVVKDLGATPADATAKFVADQVKYNKIFVTRYSKINLPHPSNVLMNISLIRLIEMRLDRLVKQTKTSAPDIRLAHPPCTTDSECMVNNHFPTITM